MRKLSGAALLLAFVSFSARAWALPSGLAKSKFVGGLSKPTAMAFAPDGRIFVTERGTPTMSTAKIRIIKNGTLLSTPFATINVDNTDLGTQPNERGLLGIALDPNFSDPNNAWVYVYYTAPGTPHNRVARYKANGDVATGSPVVLAEFETLKTGRHNGGSLHFGKDGKLYIGVGENGDQNNAQSKTVNLGKILRINPDGSIPTDNPFFGQGNTATNRIWALGLRNPFTFDVQPGTGRIFINDVGESTWEEINDLAKGKNYGWGTNGQKNDGDSTAFFKYDHNKGKSICGGAFYNPTVVPTGMSSFVGKYFFGDYVTNIIQVINPADKTRSDFDGGYSSGIVDIDVGPDGFIYVTLVNSGEIWRIRPAASIVVSTNTVTVNEASTSSFTVKLGKQPSATTTVALTKSSGDSSITFSPSSLSFTTSNWNTAQKVTVTAADDSDTFNESALVVVAASGIGSERVMINAMDNDDGSAPNTLISAPLEGDVLRGRGLEFYGGSNLDGSTAKGQFFIDGTLGYTDNGGGHYHWLGGHTTFDSTKLKEGAHQLRLSITDSAGHVGSHQINVSVDNLPSPWDHQDVGAVGAAGSASQSGGVYTINGSGADVFGTADELHFVFKTLSGDGEIKARVTAVQNTNAWAKAGVMIRETLAANSKHAFMLLSGAGQLSFQHRDATGGMSAATNGATVGAPRWVRLKRAGSTLTAFQSTDGSTWSTAGTATIPMATAVMVGLAVSSHVDGTLCAAKLDNVSTMGSTSATSLQLLTLDGEEIDDSPGTEPAPPADEPSGGGTFGCGGGEMHGRSAAAAVAPGPALLALVFRRRRRR